MPLLRPIDVLPADQVGPVHFIAAGGAGMSGIARLFALRGIPTSGSDQQDSATLRALTGDGVTTFVGHQAEHVGDAATVVVSSAVRDTNVELQEAKRRGLRIWHRSAALASLMVGKRGVTITGTHGKTTTTGMTAVMLRAAGVAPSYVIGSPLADTGFSSDLGEGDVFVVEADESDGSFLQYPTKIAVITNIDADHLDNWGTPQAYADGFWAFASRPGVEAVVMNADDPGSAAMAADLLADGHRVIRYGVAETADVRISDVADDGWRISATLTYGAESSRLELRQPGLHNMSNAAAAYAVGRLVGLSHQAAIDGLHAFRGTQRRFQLVTHQQDVMVYDDYAHHPTEVAALLTSARRAVDSHNASTGQSGRLVACFQPHLYTRTVDFADEFGQMLALADAVVICDIYSAREDPIPGVTGEMVADAVRRHGAQDVVYVPDLSNVARELYDIAQPGDVVLTIGAGDVTTVGPQLAELLSAGLGQ